MKKGNSRLITLLHIKDIFASQVSKEYGFSYNELVILNYIKERGGVSQGAFIKRLKLDKSSVTKVINKLEKAGYIKRVANTADLRHKVIVGSPLLDETYLPKASFTDTFFEYMTQECTEEEIFTFYKVVTKICQKAVCEQENDFLELTAHFEKKSLEKEQTTKTEE